MADWRYYQIEMQDEDRDGPRANWGKSVTLMYEVNDEGFVTRQVELYKNGRTLFYDQEHVSDEYSYLSETRFQQDEVGAMQPFRVPRTEFERAWRTLRALNYTPKR